MKRFRCYNCTHEFIAKEPLCLKCGLDGREPRYATHVVEIKTIHYDPPSKVYGVGMGCRACDQNTPINRGRGTGIAKIVNCDACKESAEWKQAMDYDDTGIPPGEDFPVEIDRAKMTIRRG